MSNGADFAAARVGQKIAGKLRLERVLGVGGMGVVYEAVNEATQRRFAVKLIHPEVTRDPAGRERIAREATAPNEIGHPGVVAVYDAGTDADGTLYLCMELLEGRSLRERLATEPTSLAEAVGHVLSALDPLAAAHAKGFVHRDLKPENVFLAKDGVKLVDFGLVRRADATSASMTGQTIGTVHYMSPEQARGSTQATAASDVWSVGVMLYEILAGRRPFEGGSALDVMMKAAGEPHAPLAGELPASLTALVDACLAKDAGSRPPDAAALSERLSGALDDLRASEAGTRPVDAEGFARELARTRAGATVPMSGSDAAPVAPTVALRSAPGAEEPDFDDLKIPSGGSSALKIALGLLVVALLVGGALFALAIGARSYDPTQVVLGLRGGGSELDVRLLDGFDAEVRRFGFLPTKAGTVESREALIDAAREAGAAHAVLLDLSSQRVRDGLTTETGFFRQGLTVRLYDASSAEEVAAHELTFGHEALAGSEVAEELLSAWIHLLGPQLVETLYERPNVIEAMQSATDVQIAARAIELTNSQSDVRTIHETRAQITERCRQLGEAHDAANASSTPRVRCYGDPCGETYLVGLMPDARHAVVQVESSRPYVNFQAELRFAETEERIERVPLEGGEPVVLATAANFYGVGGMAPGGTAVAVIEQGRGNNLGVIGLDAAAGARRVVAVLGARRAPGDIQPSPDGRAALLTSYGHGVMVRDGRERPVRGFGLTGARWVSVPGLEVPHVVAAYARWTDQIVLLRDDAEPAIDPVPLVGRFEAVAGAHNGLVHFVLRDAAGCHHARFDPSSRDMVSVTPIAECISQPRLTSDGRLVGVAITSGPDDTPGDPEIVVVDPDDGRLRQLTRGTFREANPTVMGERVAFERHLDNPEGLTFDARRSVVCWVDL